MAMQIVKGMRKIGQYFEGNLSVASHAVLVTSRIRKALLLSVRKESRMLADYVEHRLPLFFPYNS